ncbi:hypothetical protein OUZ56_019213 [Daphnia magna]|uniref:Uncharacterized protein n=1 Tax=Daphnia magna TaxID=35525 RepID=A0ABQ9ZAZ0_9CRUS|nr:hypothetical protein OUZ56_019213 [Daphnia magna]
MKLNVLGANQRWGYVKFPYTFPPCVVHMSSWNKALTRRLSSSTTIHSPSSDRITPSCIENKTRLTTILIRNYDCLLASDRQRQTYMKSIVLNPKMLLTTEMFKKRCFAIDSETQTIRAEKGSGATSASELIIVSKTLLPGKFKKMMSSD